MHNEACVEEFADVVAEMDALRLIGANRNPAGFRDSLLMGHVEDGQAAAVFGSACSPSKTQNSPLCTMWRCNSD